MLNERIEFTYQHSTGAHPSSYYITGTAIYIDSDRDFLVRVDRVPDLPANFPDYVFVRAIDCKQEGTV